jgi:hypothetical protein
LRFVYSLLATRYPLPLMALGLVVAACSSTAPTSQFPFGFTLKASPGQLIVPHGGAGVDTLTITSINGFSGDVTLLSDSTVNCSLSAQDVTVVPGSPAQSVAVCSRPEPGRQGMLFTALAPGFQTVFLTVLLIQE